MYIQYIMSHILYSAVVYHLHQVLETAELAIVEVPSSMLMFWSNRTSLFYSTVYVTNSLRAHVVTV